MYELLSKVKPVHIMHLPYTQQGKAAVGYWTSAFEELAAFLADNGGKSIDSDELRAEIKLQNRIRKTLYDVALLAANPRSPVTASDMLAVQESKSFSVYQDRYLDKLMRVKSALENYLDLPDLSGDRRPRILLTGCPVGKGSDKVVLVAQSLGARIAAMENCSGIKGMTLGVGEEADPFHALINRYLQIPCSCMTPNDGRMDDIGSLVEMFDVDAVLDLTWVGCHTYNGESYLVQQYVEDTLGKPFLHLETDYSESDTEQLKTRIEALLELI